jgi:Rps23 Pro-64 3,4-dihydroxylase Tpa1-like proline 4-hydroxylase
MKVCKNCNKEFKPLHESRGQEQVYCSIKCRQTSAHLRSINKIKQSVIQENEKEISGSNGVNNSTQGIKGIIENNREFNSTQELSETPIRRNSVMSNILYSDSTTIELLRECYEAKNETIFYKLKLEQVEKELSELKIELYNLEQEFENEGEEESDYGGVLGSVLQQYKEDPINTINFASELIGNLFKPKKNETSIKS